MGKSSIQDPHKDGALEAEYSLEPYVDYTVKFQAYDIERLSRYNARKWFKAVKKELVMQSCWKVVEKFLNLTIKDNDRWGKALDQSPDWLRSDPKAQRIISRGLHTNERMTLKEYS